jgi:2-keto-4-pentenoate hydratase/2-oxohepta-3-ene-1,7-dioic acid hydratase in catechol pathway
MITLPIADSSETSTVSPSKIIALGLNYMDHVQERGVLEKGASADEAPSEPVLFAKTPNVLIGPDEAIIIPAFLDEYGFDDMRVDYEAELAVVIGKRCSRVSEEEALDYVFGYTCMNDVSQRNLQRGDRSGWFRGKSLDTFGPVGPRIVPAALLPDPQTLDIRCRLNGKTVQESNTRHMIFSVARSIAFISKQICLEPGDIIATGTPSGVGRISGGDVVEVEVEGIGVLKNPVVKEA